MTEQEKAYFERLVERREQRAETINDPEFKSGFENNIDKYTDQAHFVYELLQNADDAEATQVRFRLKKDCLIFAHNGKKRFYVSNPDTVEQDKAAHKYGSVNAITAIGSSNKPGENAIGKFGIGFMSVFQYTKTPKIYDENICFQIERLIVPKLIPDRAELRKSGETTLFVFPFDSERCSKETAYAEIARKLRCLSHPLMFLNTLDRIEYQIGEKNGTYQREETEKELFDDIVAKRMRFILNRTHDGDDSPEIEEFWFFSKGKENWNRYTVCFALETDDLGNDKLKKFDSPAFCFFQTKPSTGLHFAIHAPFLLTDNRESVKAGNEHNKDMVGKLATLVADSLVCLRDIGTRHGTRLIDDNILNIIPTSEDVFSNEDDADNLSFLPFFTAIREKMSTEKLLPTADGYVSRENAYWADTEEIAKLFSNEQLATMSRNPDAQWVFPSIGRSNGKYRQYIDGITDKKWYNEAAIIRGREKSWLNDAALTGITKEFIEQQPIAWLHRFYKWLSETDNRTQLIKRAPVFLNQDGHASAAFDENDELRLFLPSDGIEGMNTVDSELLDNPDTVDFVKNKVGIKQPLRNDYIYRIILPQYKDGVSINTKPHFKLFFDYYTEECPRAEAESFLNHIRSCKFLTYSIGEKNYRDEGKNLYFPDSNLCAYFADKPDTKFVDWNGYIALVGIECKEELRNFLSSLGVHSSVRILERSLKESEDADRKKALSLALPSPYSPSQWKMWTYPTIDGANEILRAITATGDQEKSLLLWHELLEIIRRECDRSKDFNDLLTGKCDYFYYNSKQEDFLAPIGTQLRKRAWLLNRDGHFASPSELTVSELNECYDLSDDAAEELIRFLQIKDDAPAVEEADDNLTDEQRDKIAFADEMQEIGWTREEAAEFRLWKQRKSAQSYPDSHVEKHGSSAPADEDAEDDDDRTFRKAFERQSPSKKAVLKNILQDRPETPEDLDDEDEAESDEYTPPPINFQKRIQRAEEKGRIEVDKIARERELSEQLTAASKYSYEWFRALMELEALSGNENESGSREISISFGRVELDPGTERTLLLKQPSRYIPPWMEDLAADIPLTLQVKGKELHVMIEVSSVKGYTLHTRLRNAEDMKEINLSSATASISVQSPGFLLKSLQDGFATLKLPDDYDLKASLSENIKFVFGPPGTGKTTYLAREELIPLMRKAENAKVLVLAPTNKAADVLAARITELMGEDNSYKDWLVRFGTTYDEQIEQSDIHKDRSLYLPKLPHCVLITTIARYPYDQTGGQFLREVDWDYIVIDEASMIPIANIIYPLYQSKPKQFIIAGDPLQIQPVARVEPDENIYKMVGLKSFTSPHTEPHDYEVRLLTTQYRSVPSVGEVFSRFAYGGVLKHARSEDSRRQMNVDDALNIAPLNIIKFPVSKYEGIYRAKKLRGSPYQVYSALFAYEFVAFLARKIDEANPGEAYSIGVISPYRAQADLINRLLTRERRRQM